MLGYIAITIATGIAGVIVYIYNLKEGQFEDPEDVKYQLFREEESKED